MKAGYSILLGDVVEASEVVYGDCKDFQVVCPCCREATFKVERPLKEGGASHYLAHYPATEAEQAAECERRVGSMTKKDFDAMRAEGRGQALDAFLTVLPQTSSRLFSSSFPPQVVSHAARKFLSCKESRRLISAVRKHLASMSTERQDAESHRIIAGYGRISGPVLEPWKRFHRDALQHLLTPQARPSFDRVAGTAAFMCAIDASKGLFERMDALEASMPLAKSNEEKWAIQEDYLSSVSTLVIASLPGKASVRKEVLDALATGLRARGSTGVSVKAEIHDRLVRLLATKASVVTAMTGAYYVGMAISENDTQVRFDPSSQFMQPWLPKWWVPSQEPLTVEDCTRESSFGM